jgi:hypothetical protein
MFARANALTPPAVIQVQVLAVTSWVTACRWDSALTVGRPAQAVYGALGDGAWQQLQVARGSM